MSGSTEVVVHRIGLGLEERDHQTAFHSLVDSMVQTATMDHPNIMGVLGCVTGSPEMIVVEYLANDRLDQYLRNNGKSIGPAGRIAMSRDIAHALVYLTQQGCVHTDIAARNCLVSGNMTCKVRNFHISHDIKHSVMYYMTLTGKTVFRWPAPEVARGSPASSRSDVWQFGLLLYEFWSEAKVPYSSLWESEDAMVDTLNALYSGEALPPPEDCPGEIFDLMVACWSPNSEGRPSSEALVTSLSSIWRSLNGPVASRASGGQAGEVSVYTGRMSEREPIQGDNRTWATALSASDDPSPPQTPDSPSKDFFGASPMKPFVANDDTAWRAGVDWQNVDPLADPASDFSNPLRQ
jgi:serine/threonine protein kinase